MEIRRLGVIAGNGPLPRETVLEALRQGLPVTVAAIEEEAEAGLGDLVEGASRRVEVMWLGVGELGRLLKTFHEAGVTHALMVGQVRHVRVFAPRSRAHWVDLRRLPDLRALRLLAGLESRNTEAVLKALIRTLESEGFSVLDSTAFLRHWLADGGVMTKRSPDGEEEKDITFGLPIAREVARLDIGQTIVIRDQTVVAVEAMEGTDAAVRRAAEMARGASLTVVKVARPAQDFRFDVPVVGPRTLDLCAECRVSALAVEEGRTLIIDKPRFLERADAMRLSLVGV
ncbi:MAG TPA: UDP-2,3-diacylglucosamine diphosphatase LpxI [Acidobacteriota bacterium]|nr:UDP-2,3-diacylglucosamine diphosphatase LpxI [Acidobacteriota bacterium]HRV08816.1 UDP-2,3-diacylglucosamine diphosphatase LpxI [Acidobacteriota bacterium]